MCFGIGGGVTLAFVAFAVLRASLSDLGDVPFVIAVFAQKELPPSPLFLMMTLGPLIALLPVAEQLSGTVARLLRTFGKAPLFYYLIHLPIAHALACVVSLVRSGKVDSWLFGNHPAEPPAVPTGYAWDVWYVYAVAAVVIAMMYPATQWYARRKAERPSSWMTYI
jgi:hypothetical protein